MITQIITDTLMIFLITYALVDIMYRLLKLLNRPLENTKSNQKLVMYVNSSQNLENLVLSAAKKSQNIGAELILIVESETDEIINIIQSLKVKLPYIKIIKAEDFSFNQIFSDTFSKNA